MFDLKQFSLAIKQITEERGIDENKIIETIESALAAAYKKDYGRKGQVIRVKLDDESGGLKIWQIKYVIEGVDEEGYVTGEVLHKEGADTKDDKKKEKDKDKKEEKEEKKNEERKSGAEEVSGSEEEVKIKYNPDKHLTLEEAQELDKKLKVGDEVVIPLKEEDDFGRIAAQTAKQVIIQRLREAERESIAEEYRTKIGEVISGVVQRIEGRTVYMDIGRATGVLFPMEQIPADYYKIGNRLRVYLLNVEETNRGPVILLSRSHPQLVVKLFEFEVPEITSEAIGIKAIAREPGSRTKIAVYSLQEGVDPIGSLVGQKGIRVQTVINELSGEKIDIIEWDEDIKKFIANALSPAKILQVKVLDEQKRHALVEIADDQFSLAIGKRGQNVRLAVKLTNWKLDVRSPENELKAEEAEKSTGEEEEEASEGQKHEEERGEEKGVSEKENGKDEEEHKDDNEDVSKDEEDKNEADEAVGEEKTGEPEPESETNKDEETNKKEK